ncbi:hypothetical protein EVAR_73809_1, partial [Eumeta japonica]
LLPPVRAARSRLPDFSCLRYKRYEELSSRNELTRPPPARRPPALHPPPTRAAPAQRTRLISADYFRERS